MYVKLAPVAVVCSLILLPAGESGSLSAQEVGPCPVICECSPPDLGCHCVTLTEGNGVARDCIQGGVYDCQFIVCEKMEGLFFAPDGSVVRLAVGEGDWEDAGDHVGNLVVHAGDIPRWETQSSGHAVARNCAGVIVQTYYSPRAAAAVREDGRRILI